MCRGHSVADNTLFCTEPVQCPDVPRWVQHADRVVTGTAPGDRAVYVCAVGARFPDGSRTHSVLCQTDGTWEELQGFPQCE